MKSRAIGWIVLVALFCLTLESMAQSKTKVLLNASFRKPLPDEQPTYVLELTGKEGGLYEGVVYTINDVHVVGRGEYAKFRDSYLENGKFTFYYKFGAKESEGLYEKGARVGTWKRYGPDGSEKTQRFYNPEGAAMLRKAMGYDKL